MVAEAVAEAVAADVTAALQAVVVLPHKILIVVMVVVVAAEQETILPLVEVEVVHQRVVKHPMVALVMPVQLQGHL